MDMSLPIGRAEFDDDNKSFDITLGTYTDQVVIPWLEVLRRQYIATKDKRYWKELVRWLPESWLQTRTVTMNYEVLFNICQKTQRRNHKLTEWSKEFIGWARSLPYAQELLFPDELEESK